MFLFVFRQNLVKHWNLLHIGMCCQNWKLLLLPPSDQILYYTLSTLKRGHFWKVPDVFFLSTYRILIIRILFLRGEPFARFLVSKRLAVEKWREYTNIRIDCFQKYDAQLRKYFATGAEMWSQSSQELPADRITIEDEITIIRVCFP